MTHPVLLALLVLALTLVWTPLINDLVRALDDDSPSPRVRQVPPHPGRAPTAVGNHTAMPDHSPSTQARVDENPGARQTVACTNVQRG